MPIKSEVKLSVIIPVYNVEKYFPECMESILSQSVDDIEIILVDDGATDSSGALCDKYAEENACIKVIHKENGGPAAARNTGLVEAVGQYVAFVDSDDRIEYGSLGKILQWINESTVDVCFLGASRFYLDGRREDMGDNIIRESVRGRTPEEVMHHLASRPKFSGSACTKIFRRQFLAEHDIWFPTDRNHGEDLAFCRDCFLKAESFDQLPDRYYEYRQGRNESLSRMELIVCFRDLLRYIEESVQMLTKDRKPLDKKAEYAMSFAAYEYSLIMWHYIRLEKCKKTEAYAALREYCWVMKYARNWRTKLISLVIQCVGITVAARFLEAYMKGKNKY